MCREREKGPKGLIDYLYLNNLKHTNTVTIQYMYCMLNFMEVFLLRFHTDNTAVHHSQCE